MDDHTRAVTVQAAQPSGTKPRLAPGDRVGPYSVVSYIARGAMSEVYRALGPDGLVALKVPRRPAFVRHLRREGVLLARIEHENVARVLDVSEDLRGGAPGVVREGDAPSWIAVELVEGQPLRTLCRGTIDPAQATLLADQILTGLGAIHRAGILHLDLKPENVIVQADGVAKVVDLGLGRAVTSFMAEVYLSASLVSRELPLAGTLAYMSPEQRRGQARIDARADLYAFGVLLHELLAGKLPDPATRLTRLRSELTPRWDVAIAQLTHPEAALRPRDADEARRLVAFTLAEKNTVPVAEGGHTPRDLSLADDQALEFLSPWVAGMVVGGCELIEPLGRGGFGEVWRARRGEELVAVKLALRDEARAALTVEAAASRRVEHPGVPRVLDDRTHEEPPCVVLELVEGTSLRLLINEEGKIPLAEGLRIVGGMVELVAACLRSGVVHGDLKPEHFIVAPAGARAPVWLIDFGLARMVGAPALDASLPTHATGEARGTWDYMAPELRRGEPGSGAADVYALGVCLFEVLADYLPRGPQRLRALRPEVPEEIDALALAMMDPDPRRRPGLTQVQALLSGAEAQSGLTRERPRRRWDRSDLVVGVGALIALTLSSAALLRLLSPGGPRPRPPLQVEAERPWRVRDLRGQLSGRAAWRLDGELQQLERDTTLRSGLWVGSLDKFFTDEHAQALLTEWQESTPPGPHLLLCCDPSTGRLVLAEQHQGPPQAVTLRPRLTGYEDRLRAGQPLEAVLSELLGELRASLPEAR